mmetsp:Transcript_14355/g.21907  ORF Transcript_14355/g.21907 Transcript_14355/m.21907 type:complete len:358 (-) Transcript_14355:2007-3080(-)
MKKLTFYLLGAIAFWLLMSWLLFPKFEQDTSMTSDAITSPAQLTNTFVPPPDSFSACIMFKDDTLRIREWIAYHYHVLSLRQIIIGVDGGIYPAELVTQYSDFIKITLWPRDVFAPEAEMYTSQRKKEMDAANKFFRRQTLFLRKCSLELRQQKRHWTVFIDPDEFLNFNKLTNQTLTKTNSVIPSIREEGSIYKFLNQESKKSGSYSNPCIAVPRLMFGNNVYGESVLPLDTLRFRSHAHLKDTRKNGLAKNMLDLSRISEYQLQRIKGIHQMIRKVCWSPFISFHESPLKINHYIGSKETFFHRHDARDADGRRDTYEKAANVSDGLDDSIVPWYEGFMETNGKAIVAKFLGGCF